MKTKEEELRAISETLEAGEHIRSCIWCTHDVPQSLQDTTCRGILAVTSKRLIFYSSTFGIPWLKFINYHHISSTRLEKNVLDPGSSEHIILMNRNAREVFKYLPEADALEHFLAALGQESGIDVSNHAFHM
ncbi:hypothetical protein E4V51_13510 [Paenibacillus sp. 28ISP30-2]|uniref:hypothetical protein n=1 Tax=Paenibacillus sp. 23TSA30-6 TaxID=2546104 RepID=UPI00178879E1|nr:hypothetical protein [Paenibacillus sp. 23TSA30-6]MBE0335159.1 hypothetical protein [Paenibacillus sp. 23TSA30-6]MBE0341990.1 hypothetical protein [Paenibacillus sp. 28ISP30-2]